MGFAGLLDYFVRGDGVFISLIAAMIAVEYPVRVWLRRERVDVVEGWSSIAIGLAYFFVGVPLASFVFTPLASRVHEFRFFDLPNTPAAMLGGLLLSELVYYAQHRLGHRVRLFWCIHQVHHSARDLSVATATRMPILEPLLPALFFVWVMPLLGFSGVESLFFFGFNYVHGALNHTTLIPKLGPLERWSPVVTPAMHRVHHGTEPEYLDKNYGGVLIVWDRLFGSYQPLERPPTYGLLENLDSHNPVTVTLDGFRRLGHDLRRTPGWRDRLRLLFMPPGWQPASWS